MYTVEASNLAKSFGNVHAVTDVSFAVTKGEIFGLLGPNGAGKTTSIRMLLDIFRPDGERDGEFNKRPLHNVDRRSCPEPLYGAPYLREEVGVRKPRRRGEGLVLLVVALESMTTAPIGALPQGHIEGASRQCAKHLLRGPIDCQAGCLQRRCDD